MSVLGLMSGGGGGFGVIFLSRGRGGEFPPGCLSVWLRREIFEAGVDYSGDPNTGPSVNGTIWLTEFY